MTLRLLFGIGLFLLTSAIFLPAGLMAAGEVRDGFESFALGDGLSVVALNDSVGEMAFHIIHGVPAEELAKISKDAGLSGRSFTSWINAFLVSYRGRNYLVDAGMGASTNILDRLKAAGYDPGDVDVVLITHFHGDHIGGLLGRDGKAAFPNAVLCVPKADADYFLPADGPGVPGTDLARKVTAPYVEAGKYQPFPADWTIAPGVAPLSLYGHTPGHTGFVFENGDAPLVLWGDIVHAYLVQFPNPKATVSYDVSEPGAAAARAEIFEEAALKKYIVAGAHLPFPAVGSVEKDGDAYKWVPLGEDK